MKSWLLLGASLSVGSCLFPDVDELTRCEKGCGSGAVTTGTSGAGGNVPMTYVDLIEADRPIAYFRFGEAGGADAVDQMHAFSGVYSAVTLGVEGAIAGDADTAMSFPTKAPNWTTGVFFGDNFGFRGNEPFTFELWVKPYADPGSMAWLGDDTKIEMPNPADDYFLGLYMTTGKEPNPPIFCRHVSRELGCAGSDGPVLTVGQYSHLVATYDSVTLTLYVNGIAQTPSISFKDAPDLGPDSTEFRIGNAQDFASFAGSIDEFAVYDHALTEPQVCDHYVMGVGHDSACHGG